MSLACVRASKTTSELEDSKEKESRRKEVGDKTRDKIMRPSQV